MGFVILAVSLFWVFLLFMTGARFMILLLNLDKSSQIVDWILRRSDSWVKPFFNVFGLSNKALSETAGIIEPASLIAFIVYFIVGSLVLAALRRALWGGVGGWHAPWGRFSY